MNKKILGGVSALAIGVVSAGVYLAVPASAGSPQVQPAAATGKPRANAKQRQQARKAMRRRAGVHGEATVRTKKNGFVQVTWQRGVLTAKSGSGFTVRSLDGTTWQWRTAKGTKFHKDGQKADLSKLAVNDFVLVYGRAGAGDSRTANRVFAPKKVPAKATQSPTPQHG
ncbi:hypothetical protein [Actinoallomurus iriomotensis]|uniref:DUF5666 domain-containing protein n=1 Tax=Actinoallomurus iriomotensis TaxID=478107 RepID=A0A9W6RET6_9ACTN|nr:hypothetical protein [Actinoallomurus iriomotensis]GLY74488.1 hypothetical protein Airi01_027550 [Actinoallomurus iriomotensis]